MSAEGCMELQVDNIGYSPLNPRLDTRPEALDGLVQSVLEHGIIEPVVVRPAPFGGEVMWELIAGARRLEAARIAGLKRIPAVVRRRVDDRTALTLMLVENLQREDLSPIERARAYQRLLDLGFSQSEIARKVGLSSPTISSTLQLLKLPDDVQELVDEGKLSGAHGKSLTVLKDRPEEARALAREAVAQGISSHLLELRVRQHRPARSGYYSQGRPAQGQSLRRRQSILEKEAGLKLLEALDAAVTRGWTPAAALRRSTLAETLTELARWIDAQAAPGWQPGETR